LLLASLAYFSFYKKFRTRQCTDFLGQTSKWIGLKPLFSYTNSYLKTLMDFRGSIGQEKADDAAGLAPSKEENAFLTN
jgi:hypothetical protein